MIPQNTQELYKMIINTSGLHSMPVIDNNILIWDLFEKATVRAYIDSYDTCIAIISKSVPKVYYCHWHPEKDEMYDELCKLGTQGNIIVFRKLIFGTQVYYLGSTDAYHFSPIKKWHWGKLTYLKQKQAVISRIPQTKFEWTDYDISMSFIEDWLDDETIRVTGLDDGFRDFYEYWKNEDISGDIFRCKVVSENDNPFAVIAMGKNEDKHTIMELVVKPEERSKGKGTQLLKELLENSSIILEQEITSAEAVIYPSNPASQRAFEKAGFVFSHAHKDGDALYYIFSK